jgi:hypothetical protein
MLNNRSVDRQAFLLLGLLPGPAGDTGLLLSTGAGTDN